jgi:hypothetical protein
MEPFPETPPLSAAPEGLLEGHLWLLEAVDGLPLRFQLQSTGLLRFGDRTHTYDDPDELPAAYRAAVRHVRASLDREALRAAVDDVEAVDFFGVATVRRAVPYDIDRIPPFLASDVWTAETGRFRPPDATAGIFERLGLTPVSAIERELPARDFSPDDYAAPPSAWYDGPAAGVVVRNKRGQRARLSTLEAVDSPSAASTPTDSRPAESTPVSATAESAPAGSTAESTSSRPTAESLAAAYVTDARIDTVTADAADEPPLTVETITDRLVERALRERYHALGGADPAVDPAAFRSAIAALVQWRRSG